MRLVGVLGVILLLASWGARSQDKPAATLSGSDLAHNTAIQDTMPPPDFIPVDKEPTVVSKKEPVYPELALRAGIEGVVWVKVWIDREGKSKDVQIVKSDNHVFDQSALDAAKQFVFTPAMKDGKPIAVWVTVPFKFKVWKEPDEMKAYADELRKAIDHPTVIVVRGPKNLKSLINYPRQASEKGIEGTVFTSVTLTDSLTIADIKVTKSLEKNCDRAVLAGISGYDFATDKEFAAKKESNPVSIVVQFILPAKK